MVLETKIAGEYIVLSGFASFLLCLYLSNRAAGCTAQIEILTFFHLKAP